LAIDLITVLHYQIDKECSSTSNSSTTKVAIIGSKEKTTALRQATKSTPWSGFKRLSKSEQGIEVKRRKGTND
jgi:spore coat protein CotF